MNNFDHLSRTSNISNNKSSKMLLQPKNETVIYRLQNTNVSNSYYW